MRVLCVAEKPSISKSISQILSGGRYTTHNTQSQYVKNYEFDYPQTNASFIVTCVSGHLTEFDFPDPYRKWHSCNPGDLFDAPVESRVAKDKKAIEQNLLAQARRVNTLMIWTDCDREGEHIGLEIVTVCRKSNRNIVVKRARFSAIIAQQIHRAAQHPVELDLAQAEAVEARILLDLKIGAAFTRMQTLSLQTQFQALGEKLVSYGPCQFPTLGFVVQRYIQVKNFVPESFWYIFLSQTRNTPDGPQDTTFNWRRGHLFDEDVALALYAYVLESPRVRVTKVTKKETKKWKPLPLTTVELQKAGSRLLKMAPKKVLDIAEKLYQQGFVSYPRTETDQFDPQFDFVTLIQKQKLDPVWGPFANSLEQDGFNTPRKGKHDDKAHPPIHPTAHAGGLTGDEKRVYEYIARRFLACCSKDAEGWQTTVEVVCGGEFFSATGLVITRKNYLEVYPYDKWSDHPLPEFTEGEMFDPTVCELRQGQTSKPHLLTEADLVTLMDKNGIGTDATIAQHIQNIVDREYVIERMEGSTKYLIPSTLGVALVEGYDKIGLDKSVSKPQLRRETERRMVQVCERAVSKQAMLEQSLEQYKEMYRVVKDNWGTIVQSVRQYLEGNGGGGGIQPGNNHRPRGGGAGGNDDDDNGGGGGGRGGGGTGGGGTGSRGGRGGALASRGGQVRGGRGGTGGTGTSTTQNGRGKGTNDTTVVNMDVEEDFGWPARTRAPAVSAPTVLPQQRSVIPPTHVNASRSTATGSASPRVVVCECGIPAAKKTNTSGVNSKGKAFYTCSKGNCGFWKWADDIGLNPVVPIKRTYSQTNGGPDKPTRRCICDAPGLLLTVQKEGPTQGRKFWKCQNTQKEGDCGFFEWDDEPPRGVNASAGGGGGGGGGATARKCFKCDQEGHWANDCPSQEGNLNKRPRSFGTATNDVAANVTCYKCDKKGHFASACPGQSIARSKSTNTTSASKATGTCFKCGEEGHWSNACPGSTTSNLRQSSSTRSSGGTAKRGRGRGSSSAMATKAKRGRNAKKSSFAAADEW